MVFYPASRYFLTISGTLGQSASRRSALAPAEVLPPDHQQLHQRFLRMKPVFRLLPDDGIWGIHEFGADFFAAMGGQAVHVKRVGTPPTPVVAGSTDRAPD